MKLFLIWTSGSGDVIKRHFLSTLQMAPSFSRAEPLCNFGRRHHEEQFFEIILNLDQWFRRRRLKIILILSPGGPFVHQSGTFCAILVEGLIRNRANLNSSPN